MVHGGVVGEGVVEDLDGHLEVDGGGAGLEGLYCGGSRGKMWN